LLAKLSKRDAGCGKIKCIAGWSKKMWDKVQEMRNTWLFPISSLEYLQQSVSDRIASSSHWSSVRDTTWIHRNK
jgi:hypothetical protein